MRTVKAGAGAAGLSPSGEKAGCVSSAGESAVRLMGVRPPGLQEVRAPFAGEVLYVVGMPRR
jgi:hypothetical protein